MRYEIHKNIKGRDTENIAMLSVIIFNDSQ